MKQRVVVLISGRGSNLAMLVEACRRDAWPAEIAGVVGNRPGAAGLRWAAEQGLPTELVDHELHGSRQSFDEALLQACNALRPDLVVLAGFMRILGEPFVRHFGGRLINIHPSLLPAFGGLHSHRRVLREGAKVTGATAHYVTPELDHGPVIVQAAVPVLNDDDEASLSARVLRAEHRILPLAVGWHLRGDLRIEDGRVLHRQRAAQSMWLEG